MFLRQLISLQANLSTGFRARIVAKVNPMTSDFPYFLIVIIIAKITKLVSLFVALKRNSSVEESQMLR